MAERGPLQPPRRGEPISARYLRQENRLIRANQIINTGGVASNRNAGGTAIFSRQSPPWRFFRTPSDGIAEASGSSEILPGTAECEVFVWDGMRLILDPQRPKRLIHNPWSGKVEGNRLVAADMAFGAWWVRNEDCLPAGTSDGPSPGETQEDQNAFGLESTGVRSNRTLGARGRSRNTGRRFGETLASGEVGPSPMGDGV